MQQLKGFFRGRRLTVGCPVVVSLLPREWSYWYRRFQPLNSFLNLSKFLFRTSALSCSQKGAVASGSPAWALGIVQPFPVALPQMKLLRRSVVEFVRSVTLRAEPCP